MNGCIIVVFYEGFCLYGKFYMKKKEIIEDGNYNEWELIMEERKVTHRKSTQSHSINPYCQMIFSEARGKSV